MNNNRKIIGVTVGTPINPQMVGGDELKFAIKSTTDKAPFHHITDSANMKVLDFGMEGITEQRTTSGKNLWNAEYAKNLNNWDETFIEGGYVALPIYVGVGTTVSISLKNKLDAGISFLLGYAVITPHMGQLIYDKTNTYSKTTTSKDGYIYIGVNKNGYDNFITYANDVLQVEISDAPTDFEPFTNGPSPNPTHPQEIKLAGVLNEETGRYEHKCCVGNKNLIINEATSVSKSGVDFTVNKDGSISVKGTNTLTYGVSFFITRKMLLKAGQYVISGGDANNISVVLHVLNTYKYIYSNQNGKNFFVFTFNEDTYVEVIIQIKAGATVNDNIYPMIYVYGDDSTFAPLVAKPFTLTSDRPLTMWDKLVKRDGVYGWSIWDEKVFLKNYKSKTGSYLVFSGEYENEGVSEYFVCDWLNDKKPSFSVRNKNQLWFYGTGFESLDDLCQWAEENNVSVILKTTEEQAFIPLPEEEQTLLNNLETYYGVTNVYNEQGCPMWLEYVNDTKLYVDNQIKNAVATTQALILEN